MALMDVYVTKYALTSGIFKCEVKLLKEDMVRLSKDRYAQFFYGDEWQPTWESALRRAEEMREKKLVSLRKQIQKLEGKDFREMEDKTK